MKVYKFGGASVKDAEGIHNISQILINEGAESLAIVVSAMGKTTNMLEKVVNDYYPESKYIWGFDVPKKWAEYKQLRNESESPDFTFWDTRQVWVKDPNKFESLESFLSNSERGNISHLVLDGKTNRTEFLNEIFYND